MLPSKRHFILADYKKNATIVCTNLNLITLCDTNLIKRFMHYGVTMRFPPSKTVAYMPCLPTCSKQVLLQL